MDLCEFEASLIYKMNSRTARAITWRNSLEKQKQEREGRRETETETDYQGRDGACQTSAHLFQSIQLPQSQYYEKKAIAWDLKISDMSPF